MPQLNEIVKGLEQEFNCADFRDYCHNGVQIEGRADVWRAATAVSASLATIEEAVKLGVQLLVVHHGLFWSRDPHIVVGAKREKLRLLLENEISLLAYHLPLDAHQQLGNNWRAAIEMGWQQLEPFGELEGRCIGVKGKVSLQERATFQAAIEEYYAHPAHVAAGGKEQVESVALISGGAYRSIGEAAAAGVDCFITGNYDEPVWHEAFELGINFFALGHSATERVGPRLLSDYLADTFCIESSFIDIYNPF